MEAYKARETRDREIDHRPAPVLYQEGVDNVKVYDRPMELVIFTSTATVMTKIKAPSEVWPFFRSVMRDFGMPRSWGWKQDVKGGEEYGLLCNPH